MNHLACSIFTGTDLFLLIVCVHGCLHIIKQVIQAHVKNQGCALGLKKILQEAQGIQPQNLGCPALKVHVKCNVFLVAQRQTLGACGTRVLLEHSPANVHPLGSNVSKQLALISRLESNPNLLLFSICRWFPIPPCHPLH